MQKLLSSLVHTVINPNMWCRDFREWVFQTLPLLLLTFVSILFFYMIDTGWVPADVIVTGTRWTHWTNVRNYFTSFYVLCLCRKCAVLWLRLLSSRWNVVRFSSARVMQIFYSPSFLFTQASIRYNRQHSVGYSSIVWCGSTWLDEWRRLSTVACLDLFKMLETIS